MPKALRRYFRHDRRLFADVFAENLLSWRHPGFSIDNSVRVIDAQTQESLAQYISCPPISLKKIRYEPLKGRVRLRHEGCRHHPGSDRDSRDPASSGEGRPCAARLRSGIAELNRPPASPITWAGRDVFRLNLHTFEIRRYHA